MGWLRLAGSMNLQVSFAKEPYEKRLYSAKETYDIKEPTNGRHPIVDVTCMSASQSPSIGMLRLLHLTPLPMWHMILRACSAVGRKFSIYSVQMCKNVKRDEHIPK